MRERYLQEKAQGGGSTQSQSSYSNKATYAPSTFGGQSQWNGSTSNYDLDSQSQYMPKKQTQFQQSVEDNSWQKPKKSAKQYFDNNQFVTSAAPFGQEGGQRGHAFADQHAYSNAQKGG